MKTLFQRYWCTLFVFVIAIVSLIVSSSQVRADDSSSDDTPVPELTIQTQLDVPVGGDLADIHFPNIPSQLRGAFTNTFPIVVLLQGANVDKAQYKPFARRLARRGFVVVVPNHFVVLGPPGTPPSLLTSRVVITNVITQMSIADTDPASALYKIVDILHVGLVGHSFGGVVGLFASQSPTFDQCTFPPLSFTPFCQGTYTRPDPLTAAVFYGTNLVTPGSNPPTLTADLETTGVAIALLQGSRDSLATPANAALTYPTLEQSRALITLHGANHYGICKDNNPVGANVDPVSPTLDQSEANSLSAKWTALWLRSHLKSDAMAKFKFYGLIASDDDEISIQTN